MRRPGDERAAAAAARGVGFALEEIDVTTHPELRRAKEIRAVPVVEVDGRMLVGHATTRRLADLVLGAPAPAGRVPAGIA